MLQIHKPVLDANSTLRTAIYISNFKTTQSKRNQVTEIVNVQTRKLTAL